MARFFLFGSPCCNILLAVPYLGMVSLPFFVFFHHVEVQIRVASHPTLNSPQPGHTGGDDRAQRDLYNNTEDLGKGKMIYDSTICTC